MSLTPAPPLTAQYARRVLESWNEGPGLSHHLASASARVRGCETPLEEERREVFEAVLDDLRRCPDSRQRTAACRYLLLHLSHGSL